MTLSGHFTLNSVLHSYTYSFCMEVVALKIIGLMVDPYCQQQKCSAWTLVPGDIKFMRIFAAVLKFYINFR